MNTHTPGTTTNATNAHAGMHGGHAHPGDPHKQSEHNAAHSLITNHNATHRAIKNGSWFDPKTWQGGRIPGKNAKVIIPEGVRVTYDDTSNSRLFGLRVDGQLDFATNVDTKMIIDTFLVSSEGTLTIGTEDNPVQGNVKTTILIADNGAIDTKWDPEQLSRGIISHGTVSIHGQAKTSHLKVSKDPLAGDRTLLLESAPENWQVGDRIILTGTRYIKNSTEDEERVITSIKGNRITLDKALSYDHGTPSSELKAYVANQSRNVVVATENADRLPANQRGHVMFMHSDDVDVRYAEFNELGRTDKSKLLDDFKLVHKRFSPERVLDKNGDPITGKRTNIRGRYALHLHRTGVNGENEPATLVGNSVVGSPGWGIVQHDSYAILENNLAYDVFGSGFVTETGNEIGAWRNNISIKNQGRDQHEKFGTRNHDLGFSGTGFWFQGRLVENEGNVAAGSSDAGIFYFHRGVDQIDVLAENLPIADWAKGQHSVSPNRPPIMGFKDNEVLASRNGLRVIKNFQVQNHDARTVLDGLTAWEVVRGTELEYTAHYTLKDFKFFGAEQIYYSQVNTGLHLAKNTEDIVVDNLKAEGFERGVTLTKKIAGPKQLTDWGYVFIDAQVEDNKKPWENLNTKIDKVLKRSDIQPGRLDFKVDYAKSDLNISAKPGDSIAIVGTKTDSLGSIKLPFGNEDLDYITKGARNLVKDGYYTLPNGRRGIVVNEYISDRLTGDLRKYSFVVTVDHEYLTRNAKHLGNLNPKTIQNSSGIIPLDTLAFQYPDLSTDQSTNKHHSNGHTHAKTPPTGGHNPTDQPDPINQPNPINQPDPINQPNSLLYGRKQKDVFKGTAGNDSFDGRGGNDNLSGGKGDDFLFGNWGWDTLDGGAGNDILNGGSGKDIMTGGAGRDTFVLGKEKFYKDELITDFERGFDRLDIGALDSFGALDRNKDGIVDNAFATKQGNDLLLDLSKLGGSKILLNNVDTLTSSDFV